MKKSSPPRKAPRLDLKFWLRPAREEVRKPGVRIFLHGKILAITRD